MFNNPFKINDKIMFLIAMALFSFSIIALETIYFHQLLIVTNYLKATFIISIAMLGIATGSFISFYLLNIKTHIILLLSSIFFIISIILSYYNIINIGELKYPYFLILPFIFGSVIISSIFSKANSNTIYFTNLIASAFGVVYPIIFVALIKSENSLIMLLFIPIIFIFILSFSFSELITSIVLKIFSIIMFIIFINLLINNLKLPEKINQITFEKEIIPKMRDKYDINFINRAYIKDEKNKMYYLVGDQYDKKRAKYLLNQIGYLHDIDLNYNVKKHGSLQELFKIYNNDTRILYSEDNLLGRVELLGDDDYMNFSSNGVILDGIDNLNGAYYDPRVPRIDNAKVFIVGLSADGIVKSVKRLNNPEVSGIEINPNVLKIMNTDCQFSRFARKPYENVKVYYGEGRSFLESTNETYDLITLMNIHMEHGPICTLAPEYFHTIEGTKLLLNKLTDRGIVDYEEIILNPRSKFAFYKFIKTIIQSMKEMGIRKPQDNIIIFSWDFWGGDAFRTVMIKKSPYTEKELLNYRDFINKCEETGFYSPVNITYFPGIKTNSEIEKMIIGENTFDELVYIPDNLSAYSFTHDILKKINNYEDLDFVMQKYGFSKYNRYYLKPINQKDKNKLMTIFEQINTPYKIDIRPTTDDKPFPFNIYKNKIEVRELLFIILIFSSILFIPILFSLLRNIKNYKFSQFIYLLFFAILGFGYMLVEIVLMQKYQRFIGAPTYSLIITLGGLLLFSGIGSFVSKYFPKWIVWICIGLIPLLLFFQLFFLDNIFLYFAKYSFVNKLIISSFLLFPLTFFMGIPFPHALEIIKKNTSDEYATLMFGVSGAFSTIAATSSLLISIIYGFSMTFMIGIICYLIICLLFILITFKTS